MHFSKDAEIATKEYYVQDGTYIDPMKDTMALFAAVPVTMHLTLCYSHRFQIKLSKWQAFVKKMLKVASAITPEKPKPTETPEEKEKREKDEAQIKQYQQSKGELYLSISYTLAHADEYTHDAIQDALSKSRKTFVPTG